MKILTSVNLAGIGLHSGKTIQVNISHNPTMDGIFFYRRDKNITIPATSKHIYQTKLATIIGDKDTHVSTIEHFLAACAILNLTNLIVSIDGSEFPILDGSAWEFVRLLQSASFGYTETKRLVIKKEVSIVDGDKSITISPIKEMHNSIYEIHVDFPLIGKQDAYLNLLESNNLEEILSARTFGYESELNHLRELGLAKGASLNNVIGIGSSGEILNTFGLRSKNELANHKLLDLIGDMFLLGYQFSGHVVSVKGGHELNSKLVSAILSDPDNYELIELSE